MRILIAHALYRVPGGEDRYLNQQVQLLDTRHEVKTLLHDNSEIPTGVRAVPRLMYSLRESRAVERAIAEFEPDIVHVHNIYPAFGPAVHLAASKVGVPLVMTVHNFRLRCPNGFMFTEGAVCHRCEGGNYLHATLHRCFPSRSQAVAYASSLWVHRFILSLERRVDRFIAPSMFMRSRMLEWGIPEENIAMVPNFTESPRGDSRPGSYGLNVGRMSPEKGLDALLRALELADDPPFVFVGDGPMLGELKGLAADLGLVNTQFRGRVTPLEVRALMEEARFVAIPSIWDENAPLAALEAMAAGRPLLVTEVGGLPELVRNGEGVSCRPFDVEGMAAHIRALMRDDELCVSAGIKALARSEADFSPHVHARSLENVYQTVLTAKGGR